MDNATFIDFIRKAFFSKDAPNLQLPKACSGRLASLYEESIGECNAIKKVANVAFLAK